MTAPLALKVILVCAAAAPSSTWGIDAPGIAAVFLKYNCIWCEVAQRIQNVIPVEKLYDVVSVTLNAVVGAVALALRFPRMVAVDVVCGGTALEVSVMPPTVLVMLPMVSAWYPCKGRRWRQRHAHAIHFELPGPRINTDPDALRT